MLKAKTALVTGSTSGIGLGIAQALAARGASIILNGLSDAAQIEVLRSQIAVEQVAALALFLAGDEAGSMTGAVIALDCGWTAH